MSNAEQRSKRLLAIGSWVLLMAIGVGFLASIPRIDAVIDRASAALAGRLVIGATLTIVGAAAIAAWVGALWHAAVTRRSSDAIHWALLAVLLFGNFVASFFYYFAYVCWLRPATRAPAA